MRTFNLLTGASLAVLTSVVGLGAADAATFDWDWTTIDNSTSTQPLGDQLSVTNNGQTLTAEGFQITGNGNATSGAKFTTGISTSRLFSFGSFAGLGVTDTAEPGLGGTGTATSSPNHTISNEATTGGAQVTDLVAFQLPTIAGSSLSLSSIVLTRWGGSTGSANVSVLIGKASSLTGLVGKSVQSLESSGFELLQFGGTGLNTFGGGFTISSTTTDTNTAGEGNVGADLGDITNVSGDILIVAASLDDNGQSASQTDFIKVANVVTTSTVTRVPEPGTLTLKKKKKSKK